MGVCHREVIMFTVHRSNILRRHTNTFFNFFFILFISEMHSRQPEPLTTVVDTPVASVDCTNVKCAVVFQTAPCASDSTLVKASRHAANTCCPLLSTCECDMLVRAHTYTYVYAHSCARLSSPHARRPSHLCRCTPVKARQAIVVIDTSAVQLVMSYAQAKKLT
jgi:hypothetical protein